MSTEEMVDAIVKVYEQVHPGPASLKNDDVTSAEILRSILLPLIETDSSATGKIKFRPSPR